MASLTSNPTQLTERLFATMPSETADAVRRIVEAGATRGAVFAVGGTVRDLLLGRSLVDVDIVTEGDAIDIVRAAVPDALTMVHAAFRTASVEAAGMWIDVATARRETYSAPGMLPFVVTPADIEEDLTRRDFTVNTVALRLDE
jgi:tRNA nucleotidyltransferase (CCA-adding enzyme)